MGPDTVNLIATLGFPIVACGAMGAYVKYISDKHREQLKEIMAQHRNEMAAITETVQNNTLALQHLSDIIERSEK